MITISSLKTAITPKLHGASLARISAFYNKCREAAANMLINIDPPDTIQLTRIDNALHDKVFNYTCPSDLKGVDRIIDIRPIDSERDVDDETDVSALRQFDQKKFSANKVTIETVAGVKTLKISNMFLPPRTVIERLDSTTPSGATITAGGDVTGLTTDSLDYVTGSASLLFGLSGSTGSGTIDIDLTTPVDLSDLENVGALFKWLKFPTASRLTSVTLKWGSSSSAYWSKTVTAPQGRTAFESNAWMLLMNDWSTATETGSPDSENIDYLQVTLTYSTGAALANVKLDSLTASLGKAYEMLYYSQNIFRDASTSALKETPDADTDTITLDPIATNIFMRELLKLIYQEIKGKSMASDIALIGIELGSVEKKNGMYGAYVMRNQSQVAPSTTVYHEFDSLNGD